jgi:hypothetical protein
MDKRNLFGNLILLCRDHHKIIDDQPEIYTVEEIHRIKNEHLVWVRKNLDFDEMKQIDDEIYAGFVDTWVRLAGLDHWDGFTYCMLSGDAPLTSRQRWESFEELHDWLFNRVYPRRHLSLNNAFENFRRVLHDFRKVFSRHIAPEMAAASIVRTEKFYKIDTWDELRFNRLAKEYDVHVRLLEDLTLELTRAANHLCDEVRQRLSRTFRIKEGLLIARTGPWADLTERLLRVAYQDDERSEFPYPGLDEFMKVRARRDFSYGGDD